MRTDDFRPSDNVEDDRAGSVGSGIGMPGGRGGLGIGTIVIIGLISWYFGIDPSVLLNGAQILTGGAPVTQQGGRAPPVTAGTPTDPTGRFVALVLGDTEDRWSEIFTASGRTYHPPKLRLFRGAEPGGCGLAQSAMGPFYCPPDRQIYLDTGFFREVETRFHGCQGSACKFTAAYIIAHEAGHHIQNLLGILPKVTAQQQAAGSKAAANALQVRVELQADCLSGIWVNREEKKRPGFIEPGDIDGALATASAIGDDTLQRQATGRVTEPAGIRG